MLINKIYFVVTVMFVCNVSSSVKRVKNLVRFARDSYISNHPPLVETIPVSVVYEEESNHEAKSNNSTVSESSSDKEKSNNVEKITGTEHVVNNENSKNVEALVHETKNVAKDSLGFGDNDNSVRKTLTGQSRQSKQRKQLKDKNISARENIGAKSEIHADLKALQTTQTPIMNETINNSKSKQIKTTIASRKRERDPIVPIVESENFVYSHTGEFHYSYESGDGTKAYSAGELKNVDDENTGEAVAGGFSYTDRDGNDFSLSYTADENGYRPVGAHLPTPPPIPPAIARALAYLATKATPEPVTENIKIDEKE